MDKSGGQGTRLAIGCNRRDRGDALRLALEDLGIEVVAVRPIDDALLRGLSTEEADVLLIDLDEAVETDPLMLETLVDQTPLPVLSNDGTTSAVPPGASQSQSLRKLAAKLRDVALRRASAASSAGLPQKTPKASSRRALGQTLRSRIPRRLWVLGASVGGPQALKEFLRELRPDLPIAFIVAQHIGERFIAPLAKQLGKVTDLQVQPAAPGMVLSSGQVVIAPVPRALLIDEHRELGYGDELPPNGYRPCIDAVMDQVAQRYGKQAGGIVFSGMGDDGVRGCRALAARGGIVWAQDAESCFISSMPDRARAAGVVSLSGRPAELAHRLVEVSSEG